MAKVKILKSRILGTNERAIGAFIEFDHLQALIPLMSLTHRPISELRKEISNVLIGKVELDRILSNKTINWWLKQ